MQLIINGVTEATRDASLAASETKTINFTVAKNDAGAYTVEINGLKGTFTVAGAVQWVLIAEIIGGVFVLGIIILIIRRIIKVSSM